MTSFGQHPRRLGHLSVNPGRWSLFRRPGGTYREPVPTQKEISHRDGRVVTLRVADPADVPRIAEFYAELSADSFRRRFHSGRPKPPLLARLARIDVAPGAVSLLAEAEGRLVAEARYVPIAEDVAELALAVLDDFQGLGLGRLLLSALVDHANAAGLERLSAVVSLTNDTMLHLLTRYGTALTEPADESFVVCLEISAAGGMPGWPRTPAGQRILVERRGWFPDRRVAALRAAGHDVRQCAGPGPERAFPLVEEGRCRLAEDADRIVTLLPGDDADCAAVTAAHQRLWPGKLAR
jgi:GNAT superfamily N-acetyltransferase